MLVPTTSPTFLASMWHPSLVAPATFWDTTGCILQPFARHWFLTPALKAQHSVPLVTVPGTAPQGLCAHSVGTAPRAPPTTYVHQGVGAYNPCVCDTGGMPMYPGPCGMRGCMLHSGGRKYILQLLITSPYLCQENHQTLSLEMWTLLWSNSRRSKGYTGHRSSTHIAPQMSPQLR